MSKKEKGASTRTLLGLLLLIVGAVAAVVTVLSPESFEKDIVKSVVQYGGIVVAAIGFILLVISAVKKFNGKKEQQPVENKKAEANGGFEVVQYDNGPAVVNGNEAGNNNIRSAEVKPKQLPSDTVVPESKVRYIPQSNVQQFVKMGNRQSTEEKFAEIAKMDQTQFVIYIAKLFSLKGYQVHFTPVVDNYGVDLLVEKVGSTIAVSCIRSDKVLSDTDLKFITEGSKRYKINSTMALTNMYFDRTAVDFAKRNKIALVDRNILAENFMK